MGVARLLAVVATLLFVSLAYGEEICTSRFPKGTVVTLTATPCPDSNFIKWTGDFCNGSKVKTCTFTMPDKAVNINAQFNKKPMKPVWRRGM
jgi:hypothetical protein